MKSLPALFRPFITTLVVTGTLAASSYLVLIDKINGDTWFNSWVQLGTMMVGFYFAIRQDQKRDEKK